MGSFASSIFSVMLSWIRGAVSYLWQAVSTPEGGNMIQWLAENWLLLAVILCGAGVAIDVVVHLLRWRSYKVWASFFRRISGQSKDEEAEDVPAQPRPKPKAARMVHRHWIYADGTARTESVEQDEYRPEEDTHPWQDVTPVLPNYNLDEEAYRRQFARPGSQDAQAGGKGLEDYPSYAQAEAPIPVEKEPAEVAVPPRRSRRISRESTRSALQNLFASHDEELDLRYKPAQPAVDKETAYNKPYYPPQWKPPAEIGSVNKDE